MNGGSEPSVQQEGLDLFKYFSDDELVIEDASWEDIQERINFVAGVRKALREIDEGQGIPPDKVREEFAEGLSN